MRRNRYSDRWTSVAASIGISLFALGLAACQPAEVDRSSVLENGGSMSGGTGSGGMGSGGAPATGGNRATGGTSGGSTQTGGRASSGGANATGGNRATGGTPAATGGNRAGGATATGGNRAGGTNTTGGTNTAGGTTIRTGGAGTGGTTVKLDAGPGDAKPYVPKTPPSSGAKSQILILPGNSVSELPEGTTTLTEHLTERGFKVAYAIFSGTSLFLDDSKTKTADLTQYGLVIVPQEGNSNVGSVLAAAPIPVLCGQRASVSMDMATSPSSDPTRSAISIINNSHPVSTGLLGQVLITDARELSARVSTGKPAKAATVIATGWKGPSITVEPDPTIFVYEKGDTMVSKTAPARRVHFFISSLTEFPNLNANAWRLYDAAIDWAMEL